jgi:hypothetical protein
MANPYRAAAVAKVRQLIIEDDDARDKLIALCIKDVSIAEAVAEDADITAHQMILLLPTNLGEYFAFIFLNLFLFVVCRICLSALFLLISPPL